MHKTIILCLPPSRYLYAFQKYLQLFPFPDCHCFAIFLIRHIYCAQIPDRKFHCLLSTTFIKALPFTYPLFYHTLHCLSSQIPPPSRNQFAENSAKPNTHPNENRPRKLTFKACFAFFKNQCSETIFTRLIKKGPYLTVAVISDRMTIHGSLPGFFFCIFKYLCKRPIRVFPTCLKTGSVMMLTLYLTNIGNSRY